MLSFMGGGEEQQGRRFETESMPCTMVSGISNVHCRCAAGDPGGTNSPISKREKNDCGVLSANLYTLVGVFNFVVLHGPYGTHWQCTKLLPDTIV